MSKYLGDISAYALAVSQGYAGTEEEFAELMASYADVGQTAVDAKDAAVAAKTAAQTAATTATNKASEATTAAQSATTKAGEASTSASAATSAKDTAVSASQTATTKATEATTAAATATSAKTDAVAANTAAQSAKTAAQTAQTGAETAAASVQSSAAQIATNATDISQLKSEISDTKKDITTAGTENIFDDTVLLVDGITKTGYHEYAGKASKFNAAFGTTAIPISGATDTAYKLVFNAFCSTSTAGSGITFVFRYSDNTEVNAVVVPNNTTTKTSFTATSSASKTLTGIKITYGSVGTVIWNVSDIMLTADTSATTFVPYSTAKDRTARADIETLKTATANIDEINKAVCGVLNPKWIPCDMDINASGWTYYPKTIGINARRIAPTEGYPIKLRQGDLIGLTSYTDARYYLGWKVGSTYYSSGAWLTEDTIAPQDGDYCMMIAHLDNRLINSISELSSLFKYQVATLQDEIDDIHDAMGNGDTEQIPYYWQNYLETKVPEINNAIDTVGLDGDNFVFFTDYHVETNAGHSLGAIRRIVNSTSIDKVFYGGDTFNGNASKSVVLGYLRAFEKGLFGLHYFGIRGNHDDNTTDGGSAAVSLTDNQIYNYFVKKNEGMVVNGSPLFYYVDNNAAKIRYIVLNTANAGNSTTISSTDIQWMQDKITELTSAWHVLVLTHGLFKFVTSPGIVTTDPGYFNFGQQIVDALDAIYDSANATIIGILCGHGHYDYYKTETKGYLCVAVTSDTRQEQGGLTRTLGTVNEQAFDVVSINKTNRTFSTIRVGAGSNKTLSY